MPHVLTEEMTTNYADNLNKVLRPKKGGNPLVLDLFAGCGGLSLGFEAAGFATLGFEKDAACCETYKKNLLGHCENEHLTVETVFPAASVVIGGPPCQPFSVGGHQLGLKDARDGFPIFIKAIERLNPEIWLFENVRGILYSNRTYFEEIIKALGRLNYVVEFRLLNAVNYGVPQNRERVVCVGHRGDFKFPEPGGPKVTVGDALGALMRAVPPESKFLTASMDAYVAKYEKASFCVRPRDLHPDGPARTLTCRNLAGATGDMHRVKLADGRRRRLLMREAARLQSFPDWFEFAGGETSQFNQIGNAVAPLLAYRIACSVRAYLESQNRLSSGEIAYRNLPEQYELPLVLNSPDTPPPRKLTPCKAKSASVAAVINEALAILSGLGIPLEGLTDRNLEMMGMCFLAVADVKTSQDWPNAKDCDCGRALKSREIITYLNENFGEKISPGSYDDIRRKHLKLPTVAGIIVKSALRPNAARNDPTRAYALAADCAALVRRFGSATWDDEVDEFLSERQTLSEQLEGTREVDMVPVTMPSGQALQFTLGQHNELQKAIIEQFLAIYGHGAEVLYVGDTAKKFLVHEKDKLEALNFFELAHGELPDIVAYSRSKNWLYLIEAVHSSGPISPVRLLELQQLTNKCSAEIVYVTAFLDRDTFRKFMADIAWETEVWIADAPQHLIHFNGHRFLGPYPRQAQE